MLSASIHQPHVSRRNLGIASILLAVLLLSLSDALVKGLGEQRPLGQLLLLRSLLAVVVLIVVMRVVSPAGYAAVWASRWIWARSLCLAVMWVCYYAALPSISLSLAAACYYTAPAWMALLSRMLLGETVGPARWCAICLALAGVLLVVNPAFGSMPYTVILPLAAAVLYALAGVITWSRCRNETPLAMATNLNIALVMVGGAVMVAQMLLHGAGNGGWAPLNWRDGALLSVLGILMAAIAVAVAQAYRLAQASVIGLFDNAYILFAVMWGALLFAERPAGHELVGIALILAGALLSARARPSCAGG